MIDLSFWDNVSIGDECWAWQGAKWKAKPYGMVRRNGMTWRAHRYAWTQWFGPIPDGFHVLHRCDNPPCVRPAHLWLGTNAENMDDRDRKGRQARMQWTECPNGHPYVPANIYWYKGGRNCRICRRLAKEKFEEERSWER